MDGNTAVIMCERESTRRGRRVSHHAFDADGRILGRRVGQRPHQHLRPPVDLHRAGRRARGGGRDRRPFDDGPARHQLFVRTGHRVHARIAIRSGGQAADLRAEHGLPRDDQVHAECRTAGHDDYHCIDDTGFFQLFGKSAQEVCDLNHHLAPDRRTGPHARASARRTAS